MTRSRLLTLCLPLLAGCAGAPPPPAAGPAPATTPRSGEPAPPPPPSAAGVWLGTLPVGKHGLRLQLRYDAVQGCALDSLDQKSVGIVCHLTAGPGDAIAVDVPSVKGQWTGRISADGKTLTGSWTQGAPLPLTLARQEKAIEPPRPVMLPAMAPVDVAGLKAVLDADLKPVIDGGVLAPSTGIGVAVGVVQKGKRLVLAYGSVKPDAVFEIGSITKTFTGLLLAQLVEQKKARLDEPVRELLPAGTVPKPSGAEITLLDLSAQRSGLPRLPDNIHPADATNPYVDYDDKALFAYLASHGVEKPANATFKYSNLGVGLLGAALAYRAGAASYEALLEKQITGPLGMRETVVALPPALEKRFVEGHDGDGKPAHRWDFTTLAGLGAIRSTAADMLVYLEAQLHPEHLPASAAATPAGRTLAAAIKASHVVHGGGSGEDGEIALNWLIKKSSHLYWHNGSTGGYSSYAVFDPAKDLGVVVLANVGTSEPELTAGLAEIVLHRLNGEPAVSLVPPR